MFAQNFQISLEILLHQNKQILRGAQYFPFQVLCDKQKIQKIHHALYAEISSLRCICIQEFIFFVLSFQMVNIFRNFNIKNLCILIFSQIFRTFSKCDSTLSFLKTQKSRKSEHSKNIKIMNRHFPRQIPWEVHASKRMKKGNMNLKNGRKMTFNFSVNY